MAPWAVSFVIVLLWSLIYVGTSVLAIMVGWRYSDATQHLLLAFHNFLWAIGIILLAPWGFAVYPTLEAMSHLWEWWKDDDTKRKRKKVKKLVGAKAQAIRDKLVAAMPDAGPLGNPA